METISWQGYEYDYHEKSSDWFWALGIIGISSAVTAIIFSNVLFALLILIGAFTMALFAVKKPHLVHFEINRKGILIDKAFYPFNTLESFWITQDSKGHDTLIVKSDRVITPYLFIPLTNTEEEVVHQALKEKLTEEELHEPVAHRIFEFFGF
jgi:hypothetical protein